MTEIASASVEVLTSTSLLPLRDMIAKVREQQAEKVAAAKARQDKMVDGLLDSEA